MTMNTYETIFICPGDLPQEKIEATLEKVVTVISRSDGKINSKEHWGRKKLAYPIKRHRDGYYLYMTFASPAGIPALLDHHYRVTDTILRGLTIKIDKQRLEKMKASVRAVSAEMQAPQSVEGARPAEDHAPAPVVQQEIKK